MGSGFCFVIGRVLRKFIDMLNLSAEAFIAFLNSIPTELVLGVELLAAFSAVLIMLRIFGQAGLYLYIGVAIILANIQVLKIAQFGFYAEPVALGTILFASSYLCTDILKEHFGTQAAKKGVWLGFAAAILTNVFMMLNLGFMPPTVGEAGPGSAWAVGNHDHIAALFLPAPALLAAGMTAYLASQFHDVWLYDLLGKITKRKHLWLRNNASTMISALIDNTIFSVLAFIVFAADPLPWDTVLWTYILGTYVLRLAVAALDTPFLYLAARCIRHQDTVVAPGAASPA